MKEPLRGIDFMLCGGVDMKSREEWTTALSATAAAAGVGIASGRQTVVFFTQMQYVSWVAVATSSVLFGALCGMIVRLARQTGSRSFADICMRTLSAGKAKTAVLIYGLLMVFASAAMLMEAGRLAALTLPVHNAFAMGVLLTLGLALALCIRGMHGWRMAAATVCAVFYIALALDPRPVRIYGNYSTDLKLSGSISAAIILGALHAAMSASIAAGSVVSLEPENPVRMAMAAAVTMFALLTAANAAMLRGGERLLSQALPTVVLAARWGKIGFYACILVKWMCAVATLGAALSALSGKQPRKRES